jgi:hypothetical protein
MSFERQSKIEDGIVIPVTDTLAILTRVLHCASSEGKPYLIYVYSQITN